MRRPTLLTVLALMLALVGLPASSAASSVASEPPTAPPGLPVYLALGDSIANGQQSAEPVVDYWTTVAAWQANGYVAQFGDALRAGLDCLPAKSTSARDGCRQLQVVNIARSSVPAMDGQPDRPGVTTTIVIAEQLPVATDLLESRNHDANPRNDVEVVTITVGGNDIYGPITAACLAPDPSGCGTATATAFAGFAANYAVILGELRQAAGPDTPIIAMTYYNPLPYCQLGASPLAQPFGDWILEGGTLPGLGTLDAGFNDIVRAVAAQHHALVADTFGDLGTGDFVGGTDCLHPVKSGHTEIAAAFGEALFGAP